MEKIKQIILIARLGLKVTFSDTKMVILLLALGFIYDNGVYGILKNAKEVGAPLGMFEAFILCTNSWFYVIMFFMAFVFFLIGIPRVNSEYIFFVQRTGKLTWLLGEILHVFVASAIYLLSLFVVCVAGVSAYSFTGNVWSDYTLDFDTKYEALLSGSQLHIESDVFRYGFPFQTTVHALLLMLFGMLVLGTIVILFSIINKKVVGIMVVVVSVGNTLLFSQLHSKWMWLSPVSHSLIKTHHVYILKKYLVPLSWSYAFLLGLEVILIVLCILLLRKKNYYK